MLLLVSQTHALQQACDLGLTAIVFGQHAQLVLWPDVLNSLGSNPQLCSRLTEFGISKVYCVDVGGHQASIPSNIETIALSNDGLQSLICEEKKVFSF